MYERVVEWKLRVKYNVALEPTMLRARRECRADKSRREISILSWKRPRKGQGARDTLPLEVFSFSSEAD